MEILKITKSDGNIVPCIMEIPQKLRGIVLAVHGFSSSKECSTYQLLLRRMPPEGYGVVGIDLPGHGFEESLREELRIKGALDSIEATENYITTVWPNKPVFYFASSFGAYLTGLYISSRPHAGRRAFFRSAAVNMPDLFIKENPTEEDRKHLEELKTRGWFEMNVETARPVRITKGMMEDFENTDLFSIFDSSAYGGTRVKMAHGAEDIVIDPNKAKRFAEQFQIPITVFKDEGHSLSDHPETPDRVADLAIAFYNSQQA